MLTKKLRERVPKWKEDPQGMEELANEFSLEELLSPFCRYCVPCHHSNACHGGTRSCGAITAEVCEAFTQEIIKNTFHTMWRINKMDIEHAPMRKYFLLDELVGLMIRVEYAKEL